MNFYHFAPVDACHALMRGKKIGPIPSLCPTSNLIDHGVLTLYCRHERPLAFRLSVANSLDDDTPPDPATLEYLKLDFEERASGNQYTLAILTKRERERFLKNETLPQGASPVSATLVLTMPKNWEAKQNRALMGGIITLIADDLVTVFQNNLMQVIDARRPHNAELYPDAKSKLEPTKNIHAYAGIYLKGYQKRFDRVFQDDPHAISLKLMNARTLADLKREQTLVLTLKTITGLLGELIGFYQQNQVVKEIEETIVREVLALPKDKLTYSYQ